MKIMGIDPGSRFAGVAVIGTSGKDWKVFLCRQIVLSEKLSMPERLALLRRELDAIFSHHQVDELAIEKVFLGRNVDSAFRLGHARGVCLALAGEHKVAVSEYATRFVKKAVTGSGAADKEQVALVLQRLLGLSAELEADATDAAALAWAHAAAVETRARFRAQRGAQL